uniref:CBS domain protein n=1 Tax=mine drainage metagenome TaxID=410659 RepID=E6PWY5_9ZZZZ
MSGELFLFLSLAAAVLTLASYMVRVYGEFGKILSREVQENLDVWEREVEPRLGMSRERAGLSAAVWMHLSMGLLALGIGAVVVDRAGARLPPVDEIVQAGIGLALAVILCTQLIPFVLFQRTRGRWMVRLGWLVRGLLYAAYPVTLMVVFLVSIATLTEPPMSVEEEASGDVEALLEAGEEEGILEESDRELVRSALEFGDKLVREIMTPRPEIFAVPETMTLDAFLETLKEQNYSRVPVYAGTLDAVTGIAFAHDLLQISDEEAPTRTVASIARPVALVPETKRGYELLREMQREKQHMRVVIDEYGEVAGVVTIEDLLEEIVGKIGDEHEDADDARVEDAELESDGVWLLPGGFGVDRIEELIGARWHPESAVYESQTVGGLVCEAEGRIPLVGEVVEVGALHVEIVASSDRRVERVRLHAVGLPREEGTAVLSPALEQKGQDEGSLERSIYNTGC